MIDVCRIGKLIRYNNEPVSAAICCTLHPCHGLSDVIE